jgi:retron-type reverse transcriptase
LEKTLQGDDLALNPEWRKRITEIGRVNFVREEMLRLGFLSHLSEERQEEVRRFLDEAYPRLSELKRELASVRKQMENVEDLNNLLREVRKRRIERVRGEREARRAAKIQERAERSAAWATQKAKFPPFLGVGVSSRLTFAGGDPEKLSARGLPIVENVEDLAKLMELSAHDILWLSYERVASSVDHYTRFEIPKRSGGRRLVASPKRKLRVAQSWISETVLAALAPSRHATAFRPGTSIVQNAGIHLNAAIVVRLDIKDFFPSINFRRVRGYFEQLGYNPGVSTVFGLLCTDAPRVKVTLDDSIQYVAFGERALPQGACTSPALANLIASRLDARLAALAATIPSDWRYTRYADDMIFSSSQAAANTGRLLKGVEAIVRDEGLALNETKTAVMRAPNRQIVTGLLVGETVRLSRRDLRRLRAFLHRCAHEGITAVSNEIGKDALAVARGRLAYVSMVMPGYATNLRHEHTWL